MVKTHTHTWKTILLILLPFSVCCQHWEAGILAGYSNYMGDLVEPVFTFKNPHLAGNVNVKYFFDGNHGLRLNIFRGRISGDDRDYERNSTRGNAFEATLTEFSLLGEIDFRGHRRFVPRGFRKLVSPYFFTGLGITLASPDVKYGDPGNEDAQIDYPGWHVSIPVGGGIRKDIHERLYVGVEWSVRLTLSDNLDGTQESGHAYRNDVFVFGGLNLGYRFVEKAENVIPPKKKEPRKKG